MRASPSLSQLWQPHSRLCQLCRVCEQQRSCSPGFRRKELHATEGAVEVRRARRRLRDTVTDERVGVFTPDKGLHAHEPRSCSRHSGEAWDRLWRSGSRPSISVNSPSTPSTRKCLTTLVCRRSVTEKHARRCLFAPLARGCGRHGRRCGSHSLGGPPSHSRPGVPRVCLALRCSHAALHKAATTRGGS